MASLTANHFHAAPGLGRMRRRCKAGAFIVTAGYAVVFAMDLIWPTALRTPVEIGLEVGFVASAVLLASVAFIARILSEPMDYACTAPRGSDRSSADDLAWAVQLGENIADAHPRVPSQRREDADASSPPAVGDLEDLE